MRKPKKKSYSALKKEADRVFSIWVRKRAANEFGIATCVTCLNAFEWPRLHAGHFIPRHYLATRWDERNVNCQCPQCNIFKKGAYVEYAAFLISFYGPGIIEELLREKRKTVKFSRSDLEALIEKYSVQDLPEAKISLKRS